MKKQFLLLSILLLVPFLCVTSASANLIGMQTIYYPRILSNTNGDYKYTYYGDDDGYGLFESEATTIQISFDNNGSYLIWPGSFSLSFYVNSDGTFRDGVTDNDLEIYGTVRNGDFSFFSDYNGLLLAGEVTNFGYKKINENGRSDFDITFGYTTGILVDHGFFTNGGYNSTTAYDSSFNDSFQENHESDDAKHQTSPIPIPHAIILLGSGLVGIVGFRKIMRKNYL